MSWSEEQFKQFLAVLDKEGIQHVTSASSMSDFMMCRRKWWLKKIRKLPTPIKQYSVIGTVLHSICERYLKADDQGYDENGNPVDLYPPDWEIAYNTYPTHVETCPAHKDHPEHVSDRCFKCKCPHKVDGILTPEEQALVRKLISEGIDAGVLERHQGRAIEEEIFFEAFKNELGTVSVVGYIDCLEPDMIQDHKTTGKMKYALSKRGLDRDIQMNIYGYKAFVLDPPEEAPDKVWFRHNVYCKDPKDMRVKKTEIERSVSKIKSYYEKEIFPCFKEMLLLIRNTRIWSDIDPAANISEACNAYGGCPFLSICAGSESLEMYVKRVDRAIDSGKKKPHNNPEKGKGKGMSLLDKKTKKKDTPAATKPETKKETPKKKTSPLKAKPKASTKPKPEPEPKIENVGENVAAPWYIEGCKACSENKNPGIGTNGKPCLICITKSEGKVKETDYTQIADEEGNLCWVEKDSGEVVVKDKTISEAEVSAEETVAAETRIDEDEAKKKVSDKKKTEKKKSAEEKASRERKDKKEKDLSGEIEAGLGLDYKDSPERRKFVLLLGGTSADGTMSCGAAIGTVGRLVTLSELMVIIGESLGEIYQKKVEREEPVNFYDIDAFERRDVICANVDSIIDLLGSSSLACPLSMTTDEKSVVAVLRPYASRVFVFSP